ncbi:SRPBCC family protein [Labilibaculum euxinus]|uniref:SRPBCC domain-containing protein n=1 Tax=Labilibaculum euxinus TaxID=2686357 RepID=A0A7M4DAQ8_9BACT|nr:SRPBCC domain-containing protein [Labilibaculum euxinus]MUP39737.1 SRPBCC domain-containing protein [Labilibaculum euxinus]MVB08942.1 SRPBCC domain-containing protein [Labilibaculum euxinus]
MNSRNQIIVVEQTFNKPKEEVWSTITDPNKMREWFFENIPDFIPEVGFETRFNVDAGERQFMHIWKITEVIPFEKIVYNWRYENMYGNAFVSFELFDRDIETLLRITNLGLETFPQDIPEFSRESCTDGWEYFINQRLKEYLNQ